MTVPWLVVSEKAPLRKWQPEAMQLEVERKFQAGKGRARVRPESGSMRAEVKGQV
jgi:hypothetical protein